MPFEIKHTDQIIRDLLPGVNNYFEMSQAEVMQIDLPAWIYEVLLSNTSLFRMRVQTVPAREIIDFIYFMDKYLYPLDQLQRLYLILNEIQFSLKSDVRAALRENLDPLCPSCALDTITCLAYYLDLTEEEIKSEIDICGRRFPMHVSRFIEDWHKHTHYYYSIPDEFWSLPDAKYLEHALSHGMTTPKIALQKLAVFGNPKYLNYLLENYIFDLPELLPISHLRLKFKFTLKQYNWRTTLEMFRSREFVEYMIFTLELSAVDLHRLFRTIWRHFYMTYYYMGTRMDIICDNYEKEEFLVLKRISEDVLKLAEEKGLTGNKLLLFHHIVNFKKS